MCASLHCSGLTEGDATRELRLSNIMLNSAVLLTSSHFTPGGGSTNCHDFFLFPRLQSQVPLLLSIEYLYCLVGKVGSISDCKGRILVRCGSEIWKCEMDEDKG
jgi:hypothetical protein